ncbi:hypothetical protein P7C70_g5467, partial [Phenoliferia sp. Uapishka_3]
ATLAAAQAPANESICDYYTTAVFKNNTAANQLTLLTLLVNTAVIGSYSPSANKSVVVPGILNPNGTYNGTPVNLVPYFSGALASTNDGGAVGVKKNFLDGGGAAPLMNNTPANDMTSNQYFLLTHLYEFFGLLLGCSEVGMTGYPAYSGDGSMYDVHKFMVLDTAENDYFITQVALSAQSFGVAPADITKVGAALNLYFNNRCGAPVTVVPGMGNLTQSICTDASCPLAANSNCTGQAAVAIPSGAASAPAASGSAAATGTGSAAAAGSSGSAAAKPASAGRVGSSIAAGLFGLVGLVVIA